MLALEIESALLELEDDLEAAALLVEAGLIELEIEICGEEEEDTSDTGGAILDDTDSPILDDGGNPILGD